MTNLKQTRLQRAKKMMFPSWDNLLELEAHQAFLRAVIGPACLIVGTIVGVWWTRHTRQLEDRISQLKSVSAAANEKERADKLEGQINSLLKLTGGIDEKVTTRTSILTAEIRSRLVERLKKLPPNSVGFVSLNDTPEGRDFGAAIKTILSESGCLTGGTVNISGGSFSGMPHKGLVIQPLKPEGKPVAEELAAAFKEAGVPGVDLSDSRAFAVATGDIVQVTVGSE